MVQQKKDTSKIMYLLYKLLLNNNTFLQEHKVFYFQKKEEVKSNFNGQIQRSPLKLNKIKL